MMLTTLTDSTETQCSQHVFHSQCDTGFIQWKLGHCEQQSLCGHACAFTAYNQPVQNVFISARYGEAMFQTWWRSVHKWRHSLVYSRRTSETRHRTHKWFYILSNAMHCIGQIINIRIKTRAN